MRYRVQLPDYPCSHVVTGLTTTRGASGRLLRVAQAEWVREGFGGPRRQTDLVTLMLLHDAIAVRTPGAFPANAPKLYGATRDLQTRSAQRIAGATVEELPEPFADVQLAPPWPDEPKHYD